MRSDSDPTAPSRRLFLHAGLVSGATALATSAPASAESVVVKPGVKPFEFDEITIDELQKQMKAGSLTAKSIAEKYLARIAEIDAAGPALASVIEANPEALDIAAALDAERKAKGPRGPLHGIPVLIKDNIATADRMQTTAGSLALVGSKPAKDSAVARMLRAAGAVLLGKTNLSEWANIRSGASTSGWSGRGGLTKNPYALDRNTSGSSSGTGAAVAANLCAIGVGTETDGSIVSPSTTCGLVGLKPTVGLIGRSGIIPISHTQDTAGPMGRTVRDVAILLGALAGPDVDDPTTNAGRGKALADYTRFLDAAGVKGLRLGVCRKFTGFGDATLKIFDEALAALKGLGATLVDPADMANLGKYDDEELTVLLYELKVGLNAYLAGLGPKAPMKTLKEVIAYNEANKAKEMPYFGQDLFVKAEALGPLTDKKYRDALEKCRKMSQKEGIDAVMAKHQRDALIAPTGGPAWVTDLVNGDHFSGGSSTPAAVAGYPAITVPMGAVRGLPVGLSIFGRAWSEPTLLTVAYAFERATQARKPPRFLATAES